MNVSIKSILRKSKIVLRPDFEDQKLTSYAGLTLFEALFKRLDLKSKLVNCFKHNDSSSVYPKGSILLLLTTHIILGYRRLRDSVYYQDDEMVKRLLGLNTLPNVSTISRVMSTCDDNCVLKVSAESKNIVLMRCAQERFTRVTMDFDGTVQSTRRFAEGTAVGYNKKRKGSRSYYPLLCTIAQTEQVLDVHHRPGNVHDSNGAKEFIMNCAMHVRKSLPGVTLESRLDSAFFSDEIIDQLHQQKVEFTASVPFARFTELKDKIEQRQKWRRLDDDLSYFEMPWKPNSWENNYRFLLVRKLAKQAYRGVLQLDLFEPYDYAYEYQVIVTNKKIKAKKVIQFHCGRGSQEGVIGELKSHCSLDYIPFRSKSANHLYLLAGVMAHNLNRELQMIAYEKQRGTTEKRSSRWIFKELNTIRKNIIQRAGRLTKPQGKLKLTMNTNKKVQDEILHCFDAVTAALT